MSKAGINIGLVALAGLIAVGSALWWRASLQSDANSAVVNAKLTAQNPEGAIQEDSEISVVRKPKAAGSAFETTISSGPAVIEENSLVTFDPPGSHFEWISKNQSNFASAEPSEIPRRREAAKYGDLEAAFWMYQYYNHCRYHPRTTWQLDAHLNRVQLQLNNWLTNNKEDEEIPPWLDSKADKVEANYQLCASVGSETDLQDRALYWLEVAADGGHMPARFAYHELAPGLLVKFEAGFAAPQRVEAYQYRARQYLQSVMSSGNPDRYFMMAKVFLYGFAYEVDHPSAYAYAYASVLESGPTAERSERLLRYLDTLVSPEQRLEAERNAAAMVRSH